METTFDPECYICLSERGIAPGNISHGLCEYHKETELTRLLEAARVRRERKDADKTHKEKAHA